MDDITSKAKGWEYVSWLLCVCWEPWWYHIQGQMGWLLLIWLHRTQECVSIHPYNHRHRVNSHQLWQKPEARESILSSPQRYIWLFCVCGVLCVDWGDNFCVVRQMDWWMMMHVCWGWGRATRRHDGDIISKAKGDGRYWYVAQDTAVWINPSSCDLSFIYKIRAII